MNTRFEPDGHKYFIDDRPVPSVTQVLDEMLPGAIFHADKYYLVRGTSVHACAAFIARGKQFRCPAGIEGQVWACRMFFREHNVEVLEVEKQVYSRPHQYAGTLDMLCRINGHLTFVDWKSALSKAAEIQVGGYGVCIPDARLGLIVALQADGRYKTSQHFKLAPMRRDFLVLRGGYAIRQRFGILGATQKQEQGEGW